MKLLYIDESGDMGVEPTSSPFYTLAGIFLDSSHWKEYFHQIEGLRQLCRQRFGADYGEFKGSELFMHQGGAYRLQLTPNDVQWLYNHLMELVFDHKTERIIVTQAKSKFLSQHPISQQSTLKKDLRLRVWETFLTNFEQRLVDISDQSHEATTGIVYFDGRPDKHVNQIVKRYARKYDRDKTHPQTGIVEAPVFLDSKSSTMIQIADILAFTTNCLLRALDPIESSIRVSAAISSQIQNEWIIL